MGRLPGCTASTNRDSLHELVWRVLTHESCASLKEPKTLRLQDQQEKGFDLIAQHIPTQIRTLIVIFLPLKLLCSAATLLTARNEEQHTSQGS